MRHSPPVRMTLLFSRKRRVSTDSAELSLQWRLIQKVRWRTSARTLADDDAFVFRCIACRITDDATNAFVRWKFQATTMGTLWGAHEVPSAPIGIGVFLGHNGALDMCLCVDNVSDFMHFSPTQCLRNAKSSLRDPMLNSVFKALR